MSSAEHKAQGPTRVRVFVLTVSDTRTSDTDTSGRAIAGLLEAAGHHVAGRAIERDEPDRVAELVRQQAAIADVDAIITTGGTGLTARDSTFEAIDALLEKRLPGFGELFRMLSYHDIGPAAMLSRACAGTIGRVVVVSLPGSEAAVRLAMTKLIVPELGHLVQQAGRSGGRRDGSRESGAGSRGAGAGSREPGAGSRGGGSRESGAGSPEG